MFSVRFLLHSYNELVNSLIGISNPINSDLDFDVVGHYARPDIFKLIVIVIKIYMSMILFN